MEADQGQDVLGFDCSKFADSLGLNHNFFVWDTCISCLQSPCVCPPPTFDFDIDIDINADTDWNVNDGFLADLETQRGTLDDGKLEASHADAAHSGTSMQGQSPPDAKTEKPISKTRKRKGSKERTGSPSRKSQRTHIAESNRMVLETWFQLYAYPDDSAINSISQDTQLPSRVVKTWFANARSRKKYPQQSVMQSIENRNICSRRPSSESFPAAVSNISESNLAALEQSSPGNSRSSLERYLNSSAEDEALCATTRGNLSSFATSSLYTEELHPIWALDPSNQIGFDFVLFEEHASIDAPAAVGSDCSFSSVESSSSVGSYRSNDSRGTRRGRRSWANSGNSKVTASGAAESNRYFCTWPTCTATFRHPYQWKRHEEAIHYCHYRWICCTTETGPVKLYNCFICGETKEPLEHLASTHFASCATRMEPERTFYRQDQFAQHIKTVHFGDPLGPKIPEDLLVACRSVNPLSKEPSLFCGFCRVTLPSWEQRQEHVLDHLHKGAPKAAWRIEGLRPWCKHCSRGLEQHQEGSSCPFWSCQNLASLADTIRRKAQRFKSSIWQRWHAELRDPDGCDLRDYGGKKYYTADDFRQHVKEHHFLRATSLGLPLSSRDLEPCRTVLLASYY